MKLICYRTIGQVVFKLGQNKINYLYVSYCSQNISQTLKMIPSMRCLCWSANTLEELTIVYWVSVLDHDCQVHLALSLALKGVGSVVRTGGHPVAATRPSHDVAPRHKARATALDVCTRNHWNKLKERFSLQDINLNCSVKLDIYTSVARRLLYLWWANDHYVNFLP